MAVIQKPCCLQSMTSSQAFKWRHFQSVFILLNVCWYLRYSVSYRDLKEMMLERGANVDHTTIYRWVQAHWASDVSSLSSSPTMLYSILTSLVIPYQIFITDEVTPTKPFS